MIAMTDADDDDADVMMSGMADDDDAERDDHGDDW